MVEEFLVEEFMVEEFMVEEFIVKEFMVEKSGVKELLGWSLELKSSGFKLYAKNIKVQLT